MWCHFCKQKQYKHKSQTEAINMCFVYVCCRFDDFDDAIDEAIEEDIGDLCGGE